MRKKVFYPIPSLCNCGCNDKPWKLVPLCMHCHGRVKKYKIIDI